MFKLFVFCDQIEPPFDTRLFHLPCFSFLQKNNLAVLSAGSNENCQHMMLIFLRSTPLHKCFSGLERFLLQVLWWIMVAANYRANGHSLQLHSIQHHQPWHAINVHGEVLLETVTRKEALCVLLSLFWLVSGVVVFFSVVNPGGTKAFSCRLFKLINMFSLCL